MVVLERIKQERPLGMPKGADLHFFFFLRKVLIGLEKGIVNCI